MTNDDKMDRMKTNRDKMFQVLCTATGRALAVEPFNVGEIIAGTALFLCSNVKIAQKENPNMHVAVLQYMIELFDAENMKIEEESH